ncbi:MAG: GntR family transcriptional regulator [Synergistaceae bacterium]|nr:GntR family transcriptional regulator [Synergistaceae bacterium]
MNTNNPFSSLSQYAPSAAFNTSVETLVVQTLRSAITQGAFYPGQEIDEAAIADALQISKMPVRQAIAALEVEGLVTKVPRKKVYVTSLDKHDIEEIYTTRIALEEVAIRAAVKKAGEKDYELLEKNLAIPLSQMDGYVGFLEVDKEFHSLLYAPSGWQRVMKYLQQLRNNTAMYRILREPWPIEKIQKSLDEHLSIYEAYKKKDEETVTVLLRKHTLRTRPTITDIDFANKTKQEEHQSPWQN